MVRDESERNHEHGLLTGRSDLFQDFLKRRSEPCLVSSARTLPRHPSSERRQSTEHEGHRLGQFPFIRVPSVDEFLREAVGGEHDDRVVETPLCEELETLPDLVNEIIACRPPPAHVQKERTDLIERVGSPYGR